MADATLPCSRDEAAAPDGGQPKPRRWRRRIAWGFALLIAFAAAALIALYVLYAFTAREDSLAAALSLAQRHLPPGMSLHAEGVNGSLRHGGHIERLLWTQQDTPDGALTVTLEDFTLHWRLAALFERRLEVEALQIGRLTMHDERPPPPSAPEFAVPQEWLLPLTVHLVFRIDELRLVRPAEKPADAQNGKADEAGGDPLVRALTGRYDYDVDRGVHALLIDSLQAAQGRWRLKAQIEGRAPMPADIAVQGTLEMPAQSGAPAPVPLHAAARLAGTLSGKEARLEFNAELAPAAALPEPAPFLRAQAQLSPWQAQPLRRADAQWRQIDAAAFWPGAPRTGLDGDLRFAPEAASSAPDEAAPGAFGVLGQTRWQATLHLVNRTSGAWPQGRLPLSALDVSVRCERGALAVPALQLRLGGGHLHAQGEYQPGRGWQGQAELRGIDPGWLHPAFASAPLSGRLRAQATLTDGIALADAPLDFSIDLRADRPTDKRPGLAIETLAAAGHWSDGALVLPHLALRLRDAALEGHAQYLTATQTAQADLMLTLPGLQGALQGEIGENTGQGSLRLQLADAGQSLRWLQRWPNTDALRRQTLTGSARLDARWRGGWRDGGKDLRLETRLETPLLRLRATDAPENAALAVRDVVFSGQGTLADVAFDGQAQIAAGPQQLALVLAGRAGLTDEGWRARLELPRLAFAAQEKELRWQAALSDPAWVEAKQTRAGLQVQSSVLRLVLRGPTPDAVHLTANPLRYEQHAKHFTLESQGRLGEIPIAWLDALLNGQPDGWQAGRLAGDLTLVGDWNIRLDKSLHVQASLRRGRGDLSVQADGGGKVRAGLREARLELSSQGERLQAQLAWDSAAAGQAGATLAATLKQNPDGAWSLPEDAPLAGEWHLSLPHLETWSLFAPPGWRLTGRLQADARLGGTRDAPHLDGALRADDLAARSIVDGIAFGGGKLRARFSGQRLEIEEFSLRGAPSPRSGEPDGALRVNGAVEWDAGAGHAAPASFLHTLRANLDTRLEHLPLSTLRERQIAVSGELATRLADRRLNLRGALKIDQALIELPSDTAPTLDDDVHVRPSRRSPEGAVRPASSPVPSQAAAKSPAPVAPSSSGIGIVPDIDVSIGLGDDLRVRGRGLDTRLAGSLTVRQGTTLAALPRLTGNIRTERGTFRAYGQDLVIENGRIRFNGAPDNPALDITAVRPHLEVRVGVRIRGTAQWPAVELFSDPTLPDAEKLAWLALGRAPNGVADAALLQQAALALLSGDGRGLTGTLADALGLDDISVRGGDGDVAQSSVTLGKRFSKNFYVAYEHSVNATAGLLYFFYDINRRLKLRGETGQTSAIDLIYATSFD